MNQTVKDLLESVLAHFGIGVMRLDALQRVRANQVSDEDIATLLALPPSHLPTLLRLIRRSKSQFRQDLFAISQLDFKRGGYFVEFGATNGIESSNTYMLEQDFGWTGILAEPAKCWHSALRKNRRAHIETSCVWASSGASIDFFEANNGELSTAVQPQSDGEGGIRMQRGRSYRVPTISLTDLLEKYRAPPEVDYLSIDAEGSEFAILRHFDFTRYRFNVITCEHNHSTTRELVHELLRGQGYVRQFESISMVDDWYVRNL